MSFLKKKIPWYWTLPITLMAMLLTFMSTYIVMKVQAHLEANQAYLESNYEEDPTLAYVRQLFDLYYIGEAPEFDSSEATDLLIHQYIAATGDRYAQYMNADEYKEYASSMQGDLVGIGVQVTYDAEGESIEILYVMPDSSAEKLGLVPGDKIVAVDGVTVAQSGYDAAADAIKGEAGTKVKLTILRDGKEQQMTAERAHVTAVTVMAQMLSDERTGFIRITEFNATTPDQFKTAVDTLLSEGAKQIIFDLRNNPGGQLDSVLSVLDRILPKDSLLIRINDADGNETTESAKDDDVLDCPMTVLINSGTASAAELFTSCLRDYDKVTVVGEKSYGKGCMQYLYGLPNGGAVTITTRLYSPPISDNYDGIGITPDVEVALSEEAAKLNFYKLNEENDDQLKTALSVLDGLTK